MKDRITIEGRDGTFAAYIARPKTSPVVSERSMESTCPRIC